MSVARLVALAGLLSVPTRAAEPTFEARVRALYAESDQAWTRRDIPGVLRLVERHTAPDFRETLAAGDVLDRATAMDQYRAGLNAVLDDLLGAEARTDIERVEATRAGRLIVTNRAEQAVLLRDAECPRARRIVARTRSRDTWRDGPDGPLVDRLDILESTRVDKGCER